MILGMVLPPLNLAPLATCMNASVYGVANGGEIEEERGSIFKCFALASRYESQCWHPGIHSPFSVL